MDDRKHGSGTPTPHDFLTCKACREAGQETKEAVAKIGRWSAAMIDLSPPPEIRAADEDPDPGVRDGINVFVVIEGLAHAIFYEAERLDSDLPPALAICSEELFRLGARRESGPKAVPR